MCEGKTATNISINSIKAFINSTDHCHNGKQILQHIQYKKVNMKVLGKAVLKPTALFDFMRMHSAPTPNFSSLYAMRCLSSTEIQI